MIETTPSVHFVASTKIDYDNLQQYFDEIGAHEYKLDAPSDIEALLEVCGKLCYKSFQADLNPNLTKVRQGNDLYIQNINDVAHGSVQEHGWVTFIFNDVSRVFTHELVRHRAGTAFSQESLRFVRLTDLRFWLPQIAHTYDNENGDGVQLLKDTVQYLEGVQAKLAEIYKIEEIKNFGLKKKLTSMFRRVAPIGLATSIAFSMNMRCARFLIQLRTSRHAEEEIRLVFDKVAQMLVSEFPNLFSDFVRTEVDGIGEWISTNASAPYDQEKIKELRKFKQALTDLGMPDDEDPKEWARENLIRRS